MPPYFMEPSPLASSQAGKTVGGGVGTPNPLPPLVAVTGPTASGKSELALYLAGHLGGEILNTDALQVYRGFDIGTAKPSREEQSRIPHHLLDCVEPDEAYSAGRYVADARAVLANLTRRGKLPILCGGTGLYFRALFQGLAEIPPVPDPVRQAVAEALAERGSMGLHAELARVDPELAARIHPHDPQRVSRALEVFRATGRPLSAFQRETPFTSSVPEVLFLGVAWERSALYQRIDQRVEAMLAQGWVEEVRGLLARGLEDTLKPFQAIGYREIAQMLRGERSAEGLAEAIARRTRQYAKRQLTWFRGQPGIDWHPPGAEKQILAAAARFKEQFGIL